MKTLLLALALVLAPVLAHGSPVTFSFAGTTHQGPFNGSYTFDTEFTGLSGGTHPIGPPYGMTVHVGSLTLDLPELFFNVRNDFQNGSSLPVPVSDGYFVQGTNATQGRAFLNLVDCHGNSFDSVGIIPPALSNFIPNCSIGPPFLVSNAGGFFLEGQLTSLAQVSESASWWLLGSGLLAMVGVSRLCRPT